MKATLDYTKSNDPEILRRYAKSVAYRAEFLTKKLKKAEHLTKRKININKRLQAIELQLAQDNGGRRLNLTEAAAYLNCSKKTVKRACAAGSLSFERLGTGVRAEYRFRKSALDAYLRVISEKENLIKSIVNTVVAQSRAKGQSNTKC